MTDRHSHQASAQSNGEASLDDWMAGVTEALRLAAKDAHLLAYQADTGVVYSRDGVVDVYPPDPAMYEDLIPPPHQEGQELLSAVPVSYMGGAGSY